LAAAGFGRDWPKVVILVVAKYLLSRLVFCSAKPDTLSISQAAKPETISVPQISTTVDRADQNIEKSPAIIGVMQSR
jgi:hypothetical protein